MRRELPQPTAPDTTNTSSSSAGEALVERTAERDRLWDLSPDLLAVVDYSGRLLRVNPSWGRVLGHQESMLLTQHHTGILHPDEISRIRSLLEHMKSTQRPTRLQNRLRTFDGSWRTFVWTLSPDPGGDRFYGIGRDVTEEHS